MSTPIIAPQATPENAPSFLIQRVYLKGVSLELPNAPAIFLEQGNLEISFNLNNSRNDLEGDSKEIVLRATVEAKIGAKHVFVLEIDQAGIFELKNIPADQVEQLLQVNCPSILTPYLRSQISNTLLHASLPQFMLPEINWGGAYIENQQKLATNDTKH
jgi:preprotein translocase subunit SecB